MGTLRFVVDIPAEYLEDIARMEGAEEEQLEGISPQALADCLKDVIAAGLQPYLENEEGEIVLNVRPVRST